MSKTYEALEKAKQSFDNSIPQKQTNKKDFESTATAKPFIERHSPLPREISHWRCADLTSTTEIAVLAKTIELSVSNTAFKAFHFMSCRKSEGTSTIVFNLTRYLIETKPDNDVLILDTNMNNPALHMAFNVPCAPGFRDVLLGKMDYNDVTHKIGQSNIRFMPSGTPIVRKPANVALKDFSKLIDSIRDQFQFILIDSPPFYISPDALTVAIGSDTTHLIIQSNMNSWKAIEKIKTVFEERSCNLGGIILNRIQHVIPEWLYKRL
jgi:Mrp family chromosome partitioning ATPase